MLNNLLKNITLKKVALSIALFTILALLIIPRLVFADTQAVLLGGDLAQGTNNTSGNGTWSDPVNAVSGEIVEINVIAQNIQANTTAHNVTIKATLPSSASTKPVVNVTETADNAASVSDTATINLTDGKSQDLIYQNGHARILSQACPNYCSAPDIVTTTGINVGDLAFGQSAQVFFKVGVNNVIEETPTPTMTPTPTNVPTATPTPTGVVTATPTPTATATPTPTSAPGATATPTPTGTVTFQCPTENGGTVTITVSGSSAANFNCVSIINNNNNANTNTNSATGGNVTLTSTAVATPTPTKTTQVQAVKELPETGLPIEAWALSGMLPIGFGLRKLVSGKSVSKVAESAHFIWQQREFLKK